MAEIQNGSVVIDGGKTTSNHEFVQQMMAAATSNFKDSENYVYENMARINRAKAVIDVAFGSSNERQATDAYDRMNFDNDAYLNRIGAGSGGSSQQELTNYMQNFSFASEVSPSMTGNMVGNDSVSVSTQSFSSDILSKMMSSGQYEMNGVKYNASIDTTTNTVNLQSNYGNMFQQDNSSKLRVEIDPLSGINTMHSIITASSLSKDEIASITQSGSFSRGGITYQASALSGEAVNISTSYRENSSAAHAVYAQNNMGFQKTTYEVRGDHLNRNEITKVINTGTYDLGGMKFSAVPNPVAQFNPTQCQRLVNNANNEYANNRARINASSKSDKAMYVAEIQRKGQNYICNQSSYLKENFNGRNAKSCISHIDREINSLRSSKTAGWESKVSSLMDQKNLLIEYDKHGGRITDPTKSKSTMGRDIVMGKMLGSDMMMGVNFYRTGIRTAKTTYRAVTGAAANLGYLGTKFSNNILQKGLSSVAGKDYVGVEALKSMQNSVDKAYFSRKERIRAKKQGRYKDYKRDQKNLRFSRKGDKLISERSRLDKDRTKVLADRQRLRSSGLAGTDLDKRLIAKDERLKRRIDKNDKKQQVFGRRSERRARKAGPNLIQRTKSRFKNSTLGKVFGKISNIINFPKMLFGKLKKIITSAVISAVLGYIHFLMKMSVLIILLFLVLLFISNLPTALPTDWTDRLLYSQNYQQLIVTVTEEDIVQDLQLICEVDATNHFLSKKHVKNDKYPWYYAAKMGEVQNIWAWEESDNTSRYSDEGDTLDYDDNALLTGASGDLIYANESILQGENGNTYVSQESRQNFSSIEANMVPIVTMGHLRYYDDLDFERWPTVLGYTYYMFSISHDIARYDTEATYNHWQYGDYDDDPGYDYRLEDPHPKDALYGDTGIEWDPESHTLMRAEEMCENIYVHDFEADGYKNQVTSVTLGHASKVSDNVATRTVREISKWAQSLLSKATGNKDEKADTFDKGYTDSNDILTLNLRKASLKGIKDREVTDVAISMTIEQLAERFPDVDLDKNASGIFMFDGNGESLPHGQPESKCTRELNGLGAACDNVLFFPYGVTEDSGSESGDSDEARSIPNEDARAVDGCHDHYWKNGCYKLICGEEEREGKYVDDDGNEYTAESEGLGTVHYEAGHTHSASCYDFSVFECDHGKAYQGTGGHAPWSSKDDPGCWKTVSICGGHCGGHITPLINIVQKMTYEGLAQDDNFKTTYWLQVDEITNSAGYKYSGIFGLLDSVLGEGIVTVGQFRSYWMTKCNIWFFPIPRSPYTFAKTLAKESIKNFCEKWDAFAEACNAVLNFISGGVFGNYESDFKAPDDPITGVWADKEGSENGDTWQWQGWWLDEFNIDKSLISEMESYTGTYKENEFAAGIKNWADFDVHFGSFGLQNKIYTPEEIEAIVSQICAYYDFSGMPLDAKQKAILEAALSRCGTFGYALNGSAHLNGINNSSGYSDCSGWVTGTLLEALGVNYNTNAAGYANRGVYNGVKKPGSIIANKNGGSGYSGHVMIYAGYLEDGPDGPGHYVMDCSSSQKGSSFRKVSQSTLNRYPYVWNP